MFAEQNGGAQQQREQDQYPQGFVTPPGLSPIIIEPNSQITPRGFHVSPVASTPMRVRGVSPRWLASLFSDSMPGPSGDGSTPPPPSPVTNLEPLFDEEADDSTASIQIVYESDSSSYEEEENNEEMEEEPKTYTQL